MHQILTLKCFSSCLVVVFAPSIEVRCYVENEDVVGAVPTRHASTTSELSTILFPKVHLTLEVWWYLRKYKIFFTFPIILQHLNGTRPQVVDPLLVEGKNLFIQQSQYHGCWWPGDSRSQGISNHSIDLDFQKYSSIRTANGWSMMLT